MKLSRTIFALLLLSATALVGAQAWSDAYTRGLAALRQGLWSDARAAFKQAAAGKAGDVSGPTRLPGPVTEQRLWREGAPYSPNFGAAYALYRDALQAKDDEGRIQMLKSAATEFEALLDKKQNSRATYYFLSLIYSALRDTDAQKRLESRLSEAGKVDFKIDPEILSPEEVAAIDATAVPQGQPQPAEGGQPTQAGGNNMPTVNAGNTGTTAVPLVGRVPVVATKYALIIGNNQSKLPSGGQAFAVSDAQLFRDSIVNNCGYPEANVDVLTNATAAQILEAANKLAERVSEGGTVLIYFAGDGVDIDGKDYLAGIDSESYTDSTTLAAKADVYRAFLAKGAKIFAFYQVGRETRNGKYFGAEANLTGSIAQLHGTIPGEPVTSYVKNGAQVGIFTDALTRVMLDFRSNRIPIIDYGWQVFYAMRRAGTGTLGGGSKQVSTLPILSNMASDARF